MQEMLQLFKNQKLIHRRYAFAIIIQVCFQPSPMVTMQRELLLTLCNFLLSLRMLRDRLSHLTGCLQLVLSLLQPGVQQDVQHSVELW